MELLVFDHNGTLVDDYMLTIDCVQATCRLLGIACPTSLRDQIGSDPMVMYQKAGLPDHVTREHLYVIRELYYGAPSRMGSVQFRPDALPLLRNYHRQGLKLAVCSGERPSLLEAVIHVAGLSDVFHAIHGGVVNKYEHLLMICRELNVEPHRAAYVDDTVEGVTAARNAGLTAIAFANNTSYCRPQELRAKAPAHHFVATFTELGMLVDRLSPQK